MPSFRFQSLTSEGTVRQGVIDAPGRPAAIRQLAERGETATSLVEVDLEREPSARPPAEHPFRPGSNGQASGARPAPAAGLLGGLRLPVGRSRRPRATRSEMANFIRELATALEAGLPLMSALRTVRRQSSTTALSAILDHLIARVESGAPLHQAASEYGPPFNDLMVGMLRAADASGKMTEVLHQLADLLERSLELRREVVGATIYPAIVFCLVLASAVILVTVLVPKLIAPLTNQFEMPLPTRVLLGVAAFISGYWAWCLAGLAGCWLSWKLWVRAPANRMRVDRLKLRLPFAGRLLRDTAVARFTRTLGTLVSAGIPILDSLRITRDTLGNTAMMSVIDDLQQKVAGGKALADPLERSGLFPPLLVQVVNLGERSGRLESMLLHAANAFDRQVAGSLKLVTKAFPPVLIMIMAGVGGFVLAAILLPLLQFQSMIG